MAFRESPFARPWALAFSLFLVGQAASVVVLQSLDLDGDGLSTREEGHVLTDPRRPDTDRDGLPDGWELLRGLPPLVADADGDGLQDGTELRAAADPHQEDSDADGILDALEDPALFEDPDCDDDGAPAIADSDDDADQLADGNETSAWRCHADVDADGLLDGLEGNETCITLPDCDVDGVNDALESGAGFDALDPDTFDVHLPDGVSYAFAQRGQTAGRDEDADGIPDPWETQTGLIDWGAFDPKPGQKDLLVEFLRVMGPDSGRFADVSAAPAYALVAAAFASHGIQLQGVETHVRLDAEPIPALLPTRTASHYRAVLDRAQYAANPYVLTVVLNPQHNQTDVVHSGVAPFRGMLAAVDLGQRVRLTLQDAGGNYTVQIRPFVESLIRDEVPFTGSLAGGRRGPNTMYAIGSGIEIEWTPYWFQNPRVLHQGAWVPLNIPGRALLAPELAGTIIHEMGHTLGLCHTHEPDCQRLLPLAEQLREAESSMSYNAPDTTIAFLPSEWSRVEDYLACPPPEPVRLVAQGAGPDDVLDSKYTYNFDAEDEGVGSRECGDFETLGRNLWSQPNATVFHLSAELRDPPAVRQDERPFQAFAAGTVLGSLALAFSPVLLAVRKRRRRPPESLSERLKE